jgi:phosphatidylglycerol:prolipoprotein diacylglycerol transferase
MLQHGGLVWYGGLTFAIIFGVVYLKIKKQPILAILDLISPYIALAQSIGRIGCFLNGCCFGKYWQELNIRYPTQVFSSLSLLFIFLILKILYEKRDGFLILSKKGNIFFLYLAFYSTKRFFIEFLRGDTQPFILNLTIFQIISIAIFIFAIASFFINFSRGKSS